MIVCPHAATDAAWLGGWTNLLQGLGSALVSGVVAALTAWWVVRLSAKHDARRTQEAEARTAAGELLGRLGQLIETSGDVLTNDDHEALTRFSLQLSTAVHTFRPSIASVDQRFADELVNKIIEISSAIDALGVELPRRTAAAARYQQLLGRQLPELTRGISDWLQAQHPDHGRSAAGNAR